MKFCPNCKDDMPDELKFCTKCGSKLKTYVEAEEEAEEESEEKVIKEKKPKAKKSAAAQKEIKTKSGDMRYAGFITRFGAAFLDCIILIVLSFFLVFLGPLSFLISPIYYIYFIGKSGQTPGKNAMKIKVCNENGEAIGYGKALVRYIGYFISALPLCIGYLLIAFDSKKQGLHDKIAGTYVVHID